MKIFAQKSRLFPFLILLLCSYHTAFAALGTPLFKRTAATAPTDSLEIIAFKVDFAKEDPNNGLTTGLGKFDSDADTSRNSYALDPQGARKSNAYWEKHLNFISNYFKAVSNNKLAISYKVYPQGGQDAYTLKKGIIDYNRTVKKDGEKNAEFDSAKIVDYVQFMRDAVMAAHSSSLSPFNEPLINAGPHKKRVYLLIHAGASRLLDGGSLGNRGANTPADFIDFLADTSAFKYLKAIDSLKSDTNGIVLKAAGVDTLKTLLMCSETASQDGLNWGINGILIQQVAQAIGMPLSYDIVKGFSLTGAFDGLDFAGANAMNGFLPVWPSAWHRIYMGWDVATPVLPNAQNSAEFKLSAVSDTSAGAIRILKVPLNSAEWILLENRPRLPASEKTVKLTTDFVGGTDYTMSSDSVGNALLDSICSFETKKCTANKNKAKGILLNSNSYDAGLPASGIVAWKVNDWAIQQTLPLGYINAWQGDALRDHVRGLSLIEADGILTVGKEFQDQFGQPTYDFGGAKDILPNIHIYTDKNGKTVRDTIRSITPWGYSNTNSTAGGKTHLSIEVSLPDSATLERQKDRFSGDSVITFKSDRFSIKFNWGNVRPTQSVYPARIAPSTQERALSVVKSPSGQEHIALLSDTSIPQYFKNLGSPLFSKTTAFTIGNGKNTSIFSPSLKIDTVSISTDSALTGTALGSASVNDTLVQLSTREIRVQVLKNDSFQVLWSQKLGFVAHLAPMITPTGIWSGTAQDSAALIRWNFDGSVKKWALPAKCPAQDIAFDSATTANAGGVYAVACNGRIFKVQNDTLHEVEWNQNLYSMTAPEKMNAQQMHLVLSQFEPDSGRTQMALVGSLGLTVFLDIQGLKADFLSAPAIWSRGQILSGDYGTIRAQDGSGVAVADLNQDGKPDLIFSGLKNIWAIDANNAPLQGFPAQIPTQSGMNPFNTAVSPADFVGCNPILKDINNDATPEIICPLPSGVMYALKANGEWISSLGQGNINNGSGAFRDQNVDWPLNVGRLSWDDPTYAPWTKVNFLTDSLGRSLILSHGSEELNAYVMNTSPFNKSNQWPMSGQNSQRHNYFNARALAQAPGSGADIIQEFFTYPNPLKGPWANVHLKLGNAAQSAQIRIFDITGREVLHFDFTKLKQGANRLQHLNFDSLGSDTYSVLAEVKMNSGKVVKKWFRMAVMR